jgi:hypothetical protein
MSKRKETRPTNTSTARTAATITKAESTPSTPISPWIYAAIASVFILIVIMARMNLLSIPFERDEGSYSYIGQRLLEGEVPYKDFYEMKPPGLFYGYAAVVAIFGHTIEAMHLGFMCITLLSTLMVFLIGRSLFDIKSGAAAAAAFSLLSISKQIVGFTAQSEHILVLFAVTGFWLVLQGIQKEKWWWYLLGGIALGFAFSVKQSAVFIVVATGLFMVFNFVKPFNIKAILVNGILMVLGFSLSLGLLFSLVAMKGSWNEMMYWVLQVPAKYVNALDSKMGMERMRSQVSVTIQEYKIYWFMGLVAVGLVWLSSLEFYKKAGLTLLFPISFLAVCPGMYFYNHYFIMLMPSVAILVGGFVYILGDVMEHKMNTSFGGGLAFSIFVLGSFFIVGKQSDYYFSPNQFQILRENYGDNPFVESKPIADKINSLSQAGDECLVLGSEPQINFYSQLKSPTRHFFQGMLSVVRDSTKEWNQELKKEVEASKPKFIVFVNHPFSWVFPRDSDQEIFKWGYSYAFQNYDLIGVADILPGNFTKPVYVWDQATLTYKPKGEKYLLLLKRKDIVPATTPPQQ